MQRKSIFDYSVLPTILPVWESKHVLIHNRIEAKKKCNGYSQPLSLEKNSEGGGAVDFHLIWIAMLVNNSTFSKWIIRQLFPWAIYNQRCGVVILQIMECL